MAVFAVPHRKLTQSEVREVVDELVTDGAARTVRRDEIEAAIARLAHEKPGRDDVTRVASGPAAGGWPLARPSEA